MSTNQSSRNVRLIIGSQDWSKWIEADSGIQIGYPEYQVGSGLMPVQGTITLEFSAYDPSLPSSPHPLLNPSQWQREQTLSIEVINDAGAFEALPCSGQLLYILKAPQAPKRSLNGLQQLQIQIGCRLALEYFPPEPNKDVSGIFAGTPLDRGQIITNILSFIGVPSAIGSIPYPIDYPLPKTEGNWIQMCGELASTAGYYLRCNIAGVVIAEPVNLLPTSSVRNYVIGQDEEFWEPSGDTSEQPLEKLIVSGVKQIVTPVNTEPQVTEEIQPLGILFPDIPLGQQNPTVLATSKIMETTYLSINGIVTKQTDKEIQPLGILFPDIPLGQQNPTVLATSKIMETEWISNNNGTFIKIFKLIEPAGILYPDTQLGEQNPTVLFASNSFTDSKDAMGPPTNFGANSQNQIKEEPIKAEIFTEQLAPNKNRDRQNTINLPYAVSIGQLQAYGENFNRFLSGRASGYQFSGKIEWINPFEQVSVTDGAIVYFMKVDGLQWAINQIKASTLWYGIVCGFANAETPEEIIRPVEISLGEFVVQAISDCYILFAEILESEALAISNCWLIPTIVWGNIEAISDCYIIKNPVISSLYKAYWSLEAISSGFTENEGDSDYDLAVSGGSITTGKVGNAISALNATLSTSLPDTFWDLNANDFVGFAFWLLPFSGGSGSDQVLLANGNGSGTFSWKISLDYDSESETASIIFTVIADGSQISIERGIGTDFSIWRLVICEINKSTEGFSIKINNGAKSTEGAAGALGQSSVLNFSVTGGTSKIDELFFFSEPLDSGQESAIWNSGNGSAYPPF